jgi:hypothetical protein
MNKKLLLSLGLFLVAAVAGAQITTPGGAVSDAINAKLHKLDLLIKLVPLALKKDQYPDLLLGIQKARDIERAELKKEDDELAALEPQVSSAIDKAVNDGVYPPRDMQQSVQDKLTAMSNRRLGVGYAMIKVVTNAISSGLNAGQRKVMAGSFAPQFINPAMKPEDITDDARVSFYIRTILLDPDAYDLLVEMSKHAS